MKFWWLTGIGVAAALTAGYWYLSRTPTMTVALHEVSVGTVESTVANTRSGTIDACRRSKLSLQLGGVVDELLVDEGDHVAAGALLLRLWNKDRQARVSLAKANQQSVNHEAEVSCTNARYLSGERQRLGGLVAENLVSDEIYDALDNRAQIAELECEQSAARLARADAELALHTALLNQTRLLAPFAGVVAEINGEVGEYVTPSPPGVATPPAIDLIDDSCLYVTAPIDEVDASELEIGMAARITLDAFRGQAFDGVISRIAPYVVDREKQARTVDVDVQFSPMPDSIPLLVGYSADVEILLGVQADVLRIPTETIVDERFVLRRHPESGVLEKRPFEAGLSNWNHTEVLSGLAPGDQLVLEIGKPGIEPGVAVTAPP